MIRTHARRRSPPPTRDNFYISLAPPLLSRVAVEDGPHPLLVGIARRATAFAFSITYLLCCWSALLSAYLIVTVALHVGQHRLAAALRRTAGGVGEVSFRD